MSFESSNQAPGGLYLLAVICLILGLMGGMGLIMMSTNPPAPDRSMQQESQSGGEAAVAAPEPLLPPPTTYDFISGGLTSLLYVVTGIGLFLRSRWFGYYLGNLTGVLAIVNALAFSLTQGPGGLTFQIPRMIPPMVLLLLLNLKFSHLFKPAADRQ